MIGILQKFFGESFKKFLATMLVGMLIALNNKLGLGMDEATIHNVVMGLISYVFAQLLGDVGKQIVTALHQSVPAQKTTP